MNAAILRNLKNKSGRYLEEWIVILDRECTCTGERAAAEWLKREYRMGHITAMVVARKHAMGKTGRTEPTSNELLLGLFAGNHAARQWYQDFSAGLSNKMTGVIETPCKTYVGFGNPRQFAVLRPAKSEGLLVGLAGYDSTIGELEGVRGLGGSARICYRMLVRNESELQFAIRHALAAAIAGR
jgi:hypothetical protein